MCNCLVLFAVEWLGVDVDNCPEMFYCEPIWEQSTYADSGVYWIVGEPHFVPLIMCTCIPVMRFPAKKV